MPVVSLYGEQRIPSEASLAGLDALVFDIQDIGVRFYTYISTLRNALVAASRVGLEFWVLDRPNPNGGDRVEGPMLEPEFQSFVGTDRLPLLHGMTVGELARLFAAREGVSVQVVPVKELSRAMRWEETGLPWRAPSPNIPTLESARVYPGFGLFEGVMLSEGAGDRDPLRGRGGPLGGSGGLARSTRGAAGGSGSPVFRGAVHAPAACRRSQSAFRRRRGRRAARRDHRSGRVSAGEERSGGDSGGPQDPSGGVRVADQRRALLAGSPARNGPDPRRDRAGRAGGQPHGRRG